MSQPKLVSAIITTYNHAHYLPQAIRSVLEQDYPHKELIVVDDGSVDNTREIVSSFPEVKYVHQTNAGLPAARNTGIVHSNGEYLVFLDADDWFLEGAFRESVVVLEANPQAAFVYGTHRKINEKNEVLEGEWEKQDYAGNHYLYLLHYNYIAMHATVFYRRWVFDTVRFDPSLRACEDYDFYFKITRNHPVAYHPFPVAAYRKHSENMSGDVRLMIQTGLDVMSRQKPLLRTAEEKEWLAKGIRHWPDYYTGELYRRLRKESFLRFGKKRRMDLATLFSADKPLFFKYISLEPVMHIKTTFKKKLPSAVAAFLSDLGLYKSYTPPTGKIRRGDFDRRWPFSSNFGYDRGGPVDRYYIENFLEKNASLIKGRVLEIGDNDYTLRFGGSQVTKSDVLHVEDNNPKATFVGDLSNAPQLPDQAFDCIVLTQTLHLIYNAVDALHTCCRILKPGGVLLLTSPGITHIDQGEWRNYWYWSFTQASLERMFSEAFPANTVETQTFGNVMVATAFLWGMGYPEMKKEEMDAHDPHYQVIITAKAVKPEIS